MKALVVFAAVLASTQTFANPISTGQTSTAENSAVAPYARTVTTTTTTAAPTEVDDEPEFPADDAYWPKEGHTYESTERYKPEAATHLKRISPKTKQNSRKDDPWAVNTEWDGINDAEWEAETAEMATTSTTKKPKRGHRG